MYSRVYWAPSLSCPLVSPSWKKKKTEGKKKTEKGTFMTEKVCHSREHSDLKKNLSDIIPPPKKNVLRSEESTLAF